MEHLLYLAHRIPYPPNKGDKIRSYHLLRHLSSRYQVHLGTFIDDPDDWRHVDTVKGLCGETYFGRLDPRMARLRSLTALAGGRPLSLDYYRDAGLQKWVDRLCAKLPVSRVLVFSSAMAQFVRPEQYARRVIDFVDIDSDKWTQYAQQKSWPMNRVYAREGRLLLRYERRVARDFDASLFVSPQEAAMFAGMAPESAARVASFSNGVDSAYFSPHHDFDNPYGDGAPVMVFTGAMDYWPNVDAVQWFAKDILPGIQARHAGARFYIVGSRPAREVQELAALPGVHVTGTVPDVRPYIAHAHLAVAPLRIARGIQNKVLEAMAMAKRVLVSPQALEGIAATPGHELLLASDEASFVEEACAALTDGNAEMERAARARVEASYNWDVNMARVHALLEIPPEPIKSASPCY
ncbi:TIGR03087 family PEP-CTERM/XrtA system glycosyltransferase [Noviherbaspirillum pedocola]|uniref:TIGR03087 family PEP-CTERM/XrtA system glycosyltransferase n=1 Tax=Noviherbaspirillum pedocola TaxID=2801341 RepID=A0A934W0M6_9BURK|nr:TIGR03087 family PEP-CTERM/XrtA system glycosyltransferase [Noviherbaspirillum pedocola]MBK4734276.1 TIGR03087 family PEP-CTERM/XrtA system glycosyltransferase [Noviherbaspirillum pedocola]